MSVPLVGSFAVTHLLLKGAGDETSQLRQAVVDSVSASLLDDLTHNANIKHLWCVAIEKFIQIVSTNSWVSCATAAM